MKNDKFNKGNQKGKTRREFLKTSAYGAAGLLVASPFTSRLAFAQKKPINIGCISLFSGRAAVVGDSVRSAVDMWKNEVNAAGGILGREVKVNYLDSRVKIEEAVRLAREAAASGEVDFLLEGCSSREAFAVKEVSRDLNMLTISLNSKTSTLTADKDKFAPYHFRVAAQNCFDMVAGAQYAAKLSKKNGWKKWAMIGPDYAYGRENVGFFIRFLKKYYPEAEIVAELWPKIYEPDFTPYVNKMLESKADAMFTSQWGGDIVALLQQGNMYGLLDRVKVFSIDLGDFTAINPVIKSFGKFPAGLYMGTRANPSVPDTKLNRDWFNKFTEIYKSEPSGWAQQTYSGCLYYQAAVEKAGTTKQKEVRDALEGIEIISPWGTPPSQKIVMRKRDHTNIYYTEAWGKTTSKMPYVEDVQLMSWEDILKAESEWLKEKGWL